MVLLFLRAYCAPDATLSPLLINSLSHLLSTYYRLVFFFFFVGWSFNSPLMINVAVAI